MVDDDDGDDFPSPEPKTDSRSALPRKNRAWWRLRIVKRDESFSLIFFLPEREYIEFELMSVESRGAHEAGAPQGGALHPRGQGVGPLMLILSPIFFINSKTWLREVSSHSEKFLFCTKITPWRFC